MKMVEIKCPSCGGKLKVEDSQTKLITCEYCGSQFLLDDEKVQHITNYTIYQTTPSGKDQGNGAKIALGAGLACAGVLLAAFILSSGSGSSSGPRTAPPSIPAYTRPAGYLGKEGEAGEEVREGETAPKADSPLFHAMTWEMFRKDPAVQTASFGAMDWDPQDASAFTGLVKLDLGTGLSRVRGLKELKGITSMTG